MGFTVPHSIELDTILAPEGNENATTLIRCVHGVTLY